MEGGAFVKGNERSRAVPPPQITRLFVRAYGYNGIGVRLACRKDFALTNKTLILIIFASLLFRVVLISRGVQNTPDDVRYLRALDLMNTRDYGALLMTYDHLGFTLISFVPAAFQRVAALATGQPLENLFAIPALILSLSSLGCIGLIYGIARRVGASEREALLAALLAALTNCLYYWSPYVLPYDASLFAALLALYVGLRGDHARRRAFYVGLLGFSAFLIYNAHWILGGAVMVLPLLLRPRRIVERAVYTAVGFLTLPAILLLLTGGSYFSGLMQFGDTVVQGAFSEGWSLPLEYFWSSEGLLTLVWLFGLLAALITLARQPERRIGYWLLSAVGIYALLVLGSVVFQKFVVYGRTARQMVPFVVLAAAYGIDHLPRGGRRLLIAVAALVAVPNLIQPLLIEVPRVAEQRAQAEVGSYSHDSTLLNLNLTVEQPKRYVLLNAQYPYPILGIKPDPPGRVLFTMRHPFTFDPLLYEGFDAEMRAIIRASHLQMKLIDTGG